MKLNQIIQGDALEVLKTWPDEFIDCVITSPPYWGLRDYGVGGQLGLEKTPEEYVAKMVRVFREVKRVLKKDGTLWLNMGDSYASSGRSDRKESPGVGATQAMAKPGRQLKWQAGGGHNFSWSIPSFGTYIKPKDLCGIPWRLAFALQADGWWLRQDIIWHKPNPMPESVRDRCTKAHEYVFLLAKSKSYYYDGEAIREKGSGRIPGNKNPQKGVGERFAETKSGLLKAQQKLQNYRNKRSVWTITTKPFKEAHFATFPPKLIEPMIKTTRPKAVILDPFIGSGTTAYVARKLGRNYLGIELNPDYIKMAEKRLAQQSLLV